MSHKAVRLLLQDVAHSLGDKIQFGYGRLSDFNAIKDKKYPYVWADPFEITPSFTEDRYNFTKAFNISISFMTMEKEGEASTEKDYPLNMDAMSDLADQFINKLNADTTGAEDNTIALATQKLLITRMSLQPYIKRFSDIVTGYTLSFTLTIPDTFDYCSIYGNDCD